MYRNPLPARLPFGQSGRSCRSTHETQAVAHQHTSRESVQPPGQVERQRDLSLALGGSPSALPGADVVNAPDDVAVQMYGHRRVRRFRQRVQRRQGGNSLDDLAREQPHQHGDDTRELRIAPGEVARPIKFIEKKARCRPVPRISEQIVVRTRKPPLLTGVQDKQFRTQSGILDPTRGARSRSRSRSTVSRCAVIVAAVDMVLGGVRAVGQL